MSRKIIGPFSRVEGHLEIDLNRNGPSVVDAQVNSPMYRGMETILLDRPPMDALTIVPRICGICSVSQSVAAAQALAKLSDVTPPKNGQLVTNLVLACEMLSNHLTHFYLFFMPDFARDIYANRRWHNNALRFQAQHGNAQAEALDARNRFLHMMGELAGKWPHTLALRPSGTTSTVHTAQKRKLKTILTGIRRFLETTLFGCALNDMLALKSRSDLHAWTKEGRGDLGFFMHLSNALSLDEMGKSKSVLLAGGGLPLENEVLFKQGIIKDQHFAPLPVDQISEDISHSFMAGATLQFPQNAKNDPDLDQNNAYSWCKAPRLGSDRCEVGALARHVVNAHPLFCDLYAQEGSTVKSRIFARAWEMAFLVDAMENWIDQIDPNAPFYTPFTPAQDGHAFAFIEAARGTLGHWIGVENNKIINYQIIAPTTWNFSPRDQTGQPGPLESALEGAPIISGEDDPISVQHIVRSFDPCMACTVH
ncbi:MAG: nickel-dependent hydrogenase large subunit [Terasakiella sp.]|uniref:nickel-dependent hydrogenase large subunit n=1 Tax=unclassified Terasakiella TaxID=2614952 RepID=UPI003B00ABFF